ncbi:MAG: type II secretion system protein [Candidatus Eremiobacteraeota bacterium]|nr:type II secretion system protein [Candidatus Eremiobacteraeota bacterium]
MSKVRGMTLLESMVSLSLFMMIMVLMANLMSAAASAEKFLGQKDRVQEVAISCLYRMGYEAREACEWLEPASGSSSVLRFRKPDWQQESTEFVVAPTPFPADWEEDEPSRRATVEYALQGPQLVRTLKVGTESWATPLLRDCQLLEATRRGGQLTLSLTILASGQARRNSLTFSLPAEAWRVR